MSDLQVEKMSIEEAWGIANEAWGRSKKRGSTVRRKCKNCFSVWKNNGSKTAETPPLFPVDFDGCCPVCGEVMVHVLPI